MKAQTVSTIRRKFLSSKLGVLTFCLIWIGVSDSPATLENTRPDLSPTDQARVRAITAPRTGPERFEALSGGAGTSTIPASKNSFSFAASNLSFEGKQKFQIGNGLFTKVWVSAPASTIASDGLGPLFNVRSCQRCHLKDGRGHPPASDSDLRASMVMQLSVETPETRGSGNHLISYVELEPDPNYGFQLQDNAVAGVHPEGTFSVSYTEKEVALGGGEVAFLRVPTYQIENLAYGNLDANIATSPRVAQPMIGLGLLESIHAVDILNLADPDDENEDGISGRPSWIYQSGERVLGRFGWKASTASVRDQTISAFLTDMGLSTAENSMPWGDCTSEQASCRAAPHGDNSAGVEVQMKFLDFVTFYSKNLAVPIRRKVDDPEVLVGKKGFFDAGCASCHTPKFVTSRDAEDEAHRFQLIWPYTDLLLHDMGESLADNRASGSANGREWRTPPLWGIGLTKQVSGHTNFLHDGRARNLLEAVLWHGGEAQISKERVVNMTPSERESLLKFLESL